MKDILPDLILLFCTALFYLGGWLAGRERGRKDGCALADRILADRLEMLDLLRAIQVEAEGHHGIASALMQTIQSDDPYFWQRHPELVRLIEDIAGLRGDAN